MHSNHSSSLTTACTSHSAGASNFPSGMFTDEFLRNGAVVIPVIISLYIFGSLAYLCDEYFVPALERIADRLHLRADVAGATLMAIGSSSPELFTSLVGLFAAKNDVGIGAIIGSAIFNIFFVIGCCILVSPTPLVVDIPPILRDSLFYILSLIPVVVAFVTGHVNWYVSMIMVLMYGVYIIVIYYSAAIETKLKNITNKIFNNIETSDEQLPIVKVIIENGETVFKEKFNNHNHSHSNFYDEQLEPTDLHGNSSLETSEVRFQSSNIESFSRSEFVIPESMLGKVAWFIGLPVICFFWLTLPNPTNGRWAWLYPLTFVLCLFHIGALSYLLVWMVTLVGVTLRIPDIVMGLLVIAAGSSIPDALSSIIVARQGLGKMAISNCIGSNVFDILIGLGLPWLIKMTIVDYGTNVYIISNSIKFTILILIGSVAAMLIVFSISKWRLVIWTGVLMLVLYIGFVSLSILFEINVLGHFNTYRC